MLRRIPDLIDYEMTSKILSEDPSPINVVLLQEVSINVLILNRLDPFLLF